MCEPTTLAVLAIASTGASIYAGNQTAKRTADAINEQNRVQADEIARAAGQQLSERAKAAYRERAAARAAAAESGINLGSNSFLAALQTSAMNQYNDNGVIIQNEKGQQRAREASARTAMAGISVDSALTAALKIGAAGATAYAAAGGKLPKKT